MPPKLITNFTIIKEEEILFDRYNSTSTKPLSLEAKETQQQQPQHTRKQKTVSFYPIPDIEEIDHINDMKHYLNINDLWYSDKEYHTFHSDCERTALYMNNGYYDILDDEQQKIRYCTRGLEKYTIEGRKTFQLNVDVAINAVLLEQYNQRIEGINDTEYLADKYFEQSWECQIASQNQGQYDHQAVVTMQLEESRLLQMLNELAFL